MATDKLVEIDHFKDYISREAARMADFEHLKRLCERRKQVGSVPLIAGNKSSMNAKVEIDRIDGLIVEEVMKLYEKADVVEVVRCKDCRYFYSGYDEKCCINHKGIVVTDENGYCHHGVRRKFDE